MISLSLPSQLNTLKMKEYLITCILTFRFNKINDKLLNEIHYLKHFGNDLSLLHYILNEQYSALFS